MKCKHKWKCLSESITKSRFEIAASFNEFIIPSSENTTKRKHIQVFTCDKCGKLKRFVENI